MLEMVRGVVRLVRLKIMVGGDWPVVSVRAVCLEVSLAMVRHLFLQHVVALLLMHTRHHEEASESEPAHFSPIVTGLE